MLHKYFKNLYQRTMKEAYPLAHAEMSKALMNPDSMCLDCGAGGGHKYSILQNMAALKPTNYHGVEWNQALALEAQQKGLNVKQGDLNKNIPFDDNSFDCVYGLIVIASMAKQSGWATLFLRLPRRCASRNDGVFLDLVAFVNAVKQFCFQNKMSKYGGKSFVIRKHGVLFSSSVALYIRPSLPLHDFFTTSGLFYEPHH